MLPKRKHVLSCTTVIFNSLPRLKNPLFFLLLLKHKREQFQHQTILIVCNIQIQTLHVCLRPDSNIHLPSTIFLRTLHLTKRVYKAEVYNRREVYNSFPTYSQLNIIFLPKKRSCNALLSYQ